MARKIFLVCSFWVLNLFALNVFAQHALDAYRVEAPVANQSEVERLAVVKANLGNVITQVLGDSAGLQHPLVQQAINNAPGYLAKFSYSSENTIVLYYSPQAIQTLLQQAQLIAASAATAQGLTLYVTDVKDFAAFKQVQVYLKTVGVIRKLTLVSVENDILQFHLLLDGDEQLLKTTLGASNKLQIVAGDTQRPLSFRWQN